MTSKSSTTDWGQLWRSGVLPRFCFVALGITFHAGAENMISTIMPVMVRDIGGIEMAGWSFAIYEIGSIIAGAATGRLTTFWTVRANMVVAALIFALGASITAMAPSMPVALGGRLVSGFGSGALMALSMVGIQRYFPSSIWPQLIAILSAVWGVTAFAGPLYGGIVVSVLTWRWAFLLFAAAALLYSLACLVVLRNEPPPIRDGRGLSGFPAFALLCLALGITAIAAAGVETRSAIAAALVSAGVLGILAFFLIDRRRGVSRLFPSGPFDPRTKVGSGMLMVGLLALSTCSFGFYGPLLLAALHGYSPVTTGLIIASESVSWSLMSILVATAPVRHEPAIVRGGALMILGGIVGFAWAVPQGSIAALLVFALLQGGGFGLLWPFANRAVVEAARDGEQEITAAAFSTLQRMGYATGGAVAGIIANANGFSGGFSQASAATAAVPLFLYFIPIAALGVAAAFRLAHLIVTRTNVPQTR